MRYGGGIYSESGAHPVGKNLIIWGNTGLGTSGQIYDSTGTFATSYSCIQNGFSGVGNIEDDPVFTAGAFGDFYLAQTAAGQTVQSPCVDAGDTLSPMITGSTRTDGVQDAGIVDMGYHYSCVALPPPVSITMTAVNPPIQIPAIGGSFNFNASIHNGETTSQTFGVWIMVQLPSGNWWGPALGPITSEVAGSSPVDPARLNAEICGDSEERPEKPF